MKLELPVIDCDGCPGDCCGPILCTPKEFRRVERYAAEHGVTPLRQGPDRCCFAQNGRCAVHPARPLVCRIFGCADDPKLTCPHGKNKNVPIRKIQRAIDRQVRKEGVANRWLNEMVYSTEEMEEGLRAAAML